MQIMVHCIGDRNCQISFSLIGRVHRKSMMLMMKMSMVVIMMISGAKTVNDDDGESDGDADDKNSVESC